MGWGAGGGVRMAGGRLRHAGLPATVARPCFLRPWLPPSVFVPTVLIADNDRAVSALLTEILTHVGLAVRQAFDGDEALRLVREPGIAVVVCDLDMPKLSGLEVVEAMPGGAEAPPVVVISGYLDAQTCERLRALPHVREVLRKPFDLLAFSERVRQLAAGVVSGDAAGVPS